MDVRLVLLINCVVHVYCQSSTSCRKDAEWQKEYFEDISSEIESIRQLISTQQEATVCNCRQAIEEMKLDIQYIRQILSDQNQVLEAIRDKWHEIDPAAETIYSVDPESNTEDIDTTEIASASIEPSTTDPVTETIYTVDPESNTEDFDTTEIAAADVEPSTTGYLNPTTEVVITRPPTTPTSTKPRLRPGEACYNRLDIVFAFDTSGGLPRPQFTRTVEFAKRLVAQLNVGADETRIGALSFSGNIRVTFHLKDTSTLDDVQRRLSKVVYRAGKRDLKQGMNVIRDMMFMDQNGNRATVPDVAIIITDGFSGEERTTFEEESRSIAERGIELLQIVWQQSGREVVHSGDRLFAVTSADTLMGIMDEVKQAVCDVGST